MLPHTTITRITTNFKTKNNQNLQKIELYGSSTTNNLKKKYLFRWVGGVEPRNWGVRAEKIHCGGGKAVVEVPGGMGCPTFMCGG